MAKAVNKPAAHVLGGLSGKGKHYIRPPGEAKLLSAIDELRRKLRPMIEPERAIHVATREAASLLSADSFCFAVTTPGIEHSDLATMTGSAGDWDRVMLARFARGERRDPPPQVALARVKRRGRPWGVVALRWQAAHVEWEIRKALTRYINAANDVLVEIERDRIIDVRSKIDRKIMEQLRSHDLFYQILDGLRTLTRYDHSATVVIGERGLGALEVAAEKIAWRRGKSQRVGSSIEVDQTSLTRLIEHGVVGCRREGNTFVRWADGVRTDGWIAALLNRPCTNSPNEPAVGEALVAALETKDGLRAVLAISAIHPGQLGEFEAQLVGSFLAQISVSLQNSRWAEALEAQMLETERKHAMADLARGVAHDVNNALGATIPLLQQLKIDAQSGALRLDVLQEDLEQIDKSVRVCRDIFGGMLRFARTAARPEQKASVPAALEICLMILRDSLKRRNIEVVLDVADDLQALQINQSELEQLLLNLMSNARDAMSGGGNLTVAAWKEDGHVRLEVRDCGCGIAPEHLPHVLEPFFTTKSHGNGLGLSICRSIIWRSHGELEIDSALGKGTRVTVRLPVSTPESDVWVEPKAAAGAVEA